MAAEALPGVLVEHVVDESLLSGTIEAGALTPAITAQVVDRIGDAFASGEADAVMVTCSSIGPAVLHARARFDRPVLRIDEPMAERSVARGERIGVLATLATTLRPTAELVRETAAARGLSRKIVTHLCAGAFDAVIRGDVETHDALVLEGLQLLSREVDVIVLAQASMARVAGRRATPVPVLSSPALAMAQARSLLFGVS